MRLATRDLPRRLANWEQVGYSVARNNCSESPIMPPPQATLQTSALVMDGAFPHHGREEKAAPMRGSPAE
jgi:hypothetical protein